MDVTASTITVISSVWTLTIQCKNLIEGVKNSEGRINELVGKAKSFATVVGQIDDAYKAHVTIPEDLPINPNEGKIRDDIQDVLSRCQEDFQAYEMKVSSLLRQRKSGNFGVHKLLNTWREKVANPTLERFEKSIADHQSSLQSLMGIHHGHELRETRKDVREVQTAINSMFQMLETLLRSQGLGPHERPTAGRFGHLERRDSDVTLVNPPGDTDREIAASNEGENSNALHALAQEYLKRILYQMAPAKGSISLPASESQNSWGLGIRVEGTSPELDSYLHPTFSIPQYVRPKFAGAKRRMSSPDKNRRNDTSSLLSRSVTQPSDAFSDPLHTSMKRSTSEQSRSSTLATTFSSEYAVFSDGGESVARDETSLGPLDEESHCRTNRKRGFELLEAIEHDSAEIFKSLLRSDATLEERNVRGKTPLILAASLGRSEMVEQLLRLGANVQAVDKNRATALHVAVANPVNRSFRSIISLLLRFRKAGPRTFFDINSFDDAERTPLCHCVFSCCADESMMEVAKELIECGADVDAKDKAETPPICYAIENRRPLVVELLLEEGADLEFERPATTSRIGKLLDDEIDRRKAKLTPSPSLGYQKTRKNSMKSPKSPKSPQHERKNSILSPWRRKSGTKD